MSKGFKPNPLSEEEKNIIRNNYTNTTVAELVEMMPQTRASKTLYAFMDSEGLQPYVKPMYQKAKVRYRRGYVPGTFNEMEKENWLI